MAGDHCSGRWRPNWLFIDGCVIAAEDSDLPVLEIGDGTESFDPGETKILPREMKFGGPGVFTIIERDIAPLALPANK